MKRVLIIGTGLAGITLTERFLNAGIEVEVISNTALPSSTGVATGMYNPIVFKRLNKTWMIDEVMPELRKFYTDFAIKLRIDLNVEQSIYKEVTSDEYAQFWNKRAKDDGFNQYLKPIENGQGEVLQAGLILCSKMVDGYISILQQAEILKDESFDFERLKLTQTAAEYDGKTFDHIVFCEGPYAVDNPYFNWLPFKIAKGDWIIIQTESELPNKIVNNIINIIPQGGNRYKLSSTFEWETKSWEPNPEQVTPLTQAFKEIYDIPFKIVEHQSGLRPAASDRRPYLGRHPRLPMLSIFNGLGSKGVILAPYFSLHLCEHLLYGHPLLPDVDIQRHLKRFQAAMRDD